MARLGRILDEHVPVYARIVLSKPIAKLVVRRPSPAAREKPVATQVLPVVKRDELLDRCRDARDEKDPDATVVEDAELEIIIEP